MSNSRATSNPYQKFYIEPRFERGGLFRFIREKYHPSEVLYPGSSFHVTPAFYFPHVVFVDKDPAARAFFADHEMVIDLVKKRREYQRSPFIQFIFQDFTEQLPLPANQFDLLIGLFARGVLAACKSYVKIGGLYLTNNHQNDAAVAFHDKQLALIDVVQIHQGKYLSVGIEPSDLFTDRQETKQSKRYLRQTSGGVAYIESERYYIFRRVRSQQ